MSKLPSPCIDAFKLKRGGHCTGCSMTKAQKNNFKDLTEDKQRAAFLAMLVKQQACLGQYTGWQQAYAQKCAKKGVKPVLTP